MEKMNEESWKPELDKIIRNTTNNVFEMALIDWREVIMRISSEICIK